MSQISISNPMGKDVNYAKEFNEFDLNEVKQERCRLLTESREW